MPWASLGVIRPALIESAQWGSPISAQPTSATYGWCSPKGIEISSGSIATRLIPDSAVGMMLQAAHLGLAASSPGSKVRTTCEDVAIDPSSPMKVIVSFQAAQQGSIPPVYEVALVTSNLGRSWQFVPPPGSYSRVDFAGFIERRHTVEMLYSRNYFFPMKVGQSTTLVAVTPTNARFPWNDVYLGCPDGRPCVIFGPQSPQGACGMSEWQQSVLVGADAVNRLPFRWRPAGGLATIRQCGSQQLVTTTSGVEFLLDRSKSRALHLTHDGTRWTTVNLPKIDGVSVGNAPPSSSQIMTLTANGTLVAVTGTPFQSIDRLEILKPRASTWCVAVPTLPPGTKRDPIVAAQSSLTRLVVTFSSPISIDHSRTSALAIPLSALTCRT